MRSPTPNSAQGLFLCYYEYEYVPLFTNNPESFLPSFNLSFTNAPLSTEILLSCNGLLLCCTSQLLFDIDFDPVLSQPDCKLYVYNPTTNISDVFPVLPYFTIMSPVWSTLVFDPVKSPHYKVVFVEIVSVDGVVGGTCMILMYSSETGSWSVGCDVGTKRHFDLRGCGVFWNGSVHWLNFELSARNPRNSIRFHVDTRMLGEMPSPPVVIDKNDTSNYVYFGESCDHLHFIECILPRFNVYEMKKDYSEWFVKFRVDLSPFIVAYPEVIMKGFQNQDLDVIRVLSLIRGKNDKESTLVLRIPNKAIKFNLVDGTWEKMCDFVHDRLYHGSHVDENGEYSESCSYDNEYGLDYIQSLCSV